MANTKEYYIKINGLTESVSVVESLNKQLDALDKRIKALENSNVKVSAGGGGNASALSEEAAVQKEINKLKAEGERLDAKIAASQDEIYKRVDATKQLYKETLADQKAMAAQERLTADAYSNTMQGMKNHLADLKAVINTTDLGDSDKIKKMTQEANELTNKLKQMEQAYGQFGRNVGNYASAADGFKGLVVQIGDATKEFDNAKQALKELKKERDTLSTKKDMGLISEEEAKRLQDLIPTVAQLESSINDAGKPMDALMDSMQSFVAIMQTTEGLSAFFGFDNAEVDKTIKNLVALQNAMQGLQTIQKQIQTREGIGGWIAPFTVQIDKATASLLKFNTALLGTGKAANAAAKGIKMAGTAMKALISIGIVAIISVVVDKVMDLIESFNKLSAAEEAQKDAEESMSKAYGEGMAKITQYKVKLDNFNGSKEEEKKLVEELNKEFGETLGTYKSIAEWQDVMKKKSDLYVQSLVKQAKAQAALNAVTAAYGKLMQVQLGIANGEFDGIWNKIFGKSGEARLVEAEREVEQMTKMLEDSQKELEEFNKDNKLGDYAPQIKKNATKTKNAVEEAQKTLNQLELRLMRDGLNKKLRQLDEEERQTINKLKENGRKTSGEIQKIQRAYTQLRAKEIKEYVKNLENTISESAKNIESIKFDIDTSHIKNTIDSLKNDFEELKQLDMTESTLQPLTSRNDIKELRNKEIAENGYSSIKVIPDDQLTNSFKSTYNITKEFYGSLIDLLIEYQKDEQALIEENIREEEKIQRRAEADRYSAQISGLTATKAKIEEGLKAIEEKYGEVTKEGAIVVEQSNKEISEDTLNSYRDLEGQLQEINGQIEDAKQQHKDKLLEITNSANNAIKKNELDTAKDISTTQEKYYNLQISNYREFLSKLNDEVNKNPVTDKNWGIVNVAQTKKNYNEIINAAKEAVTSIETEIKKVSDDPLLTDESKAATLRELEDIKKSIIQGVTVTKEANANLIADFIKSTQTYLNAVMDSFQTIMGAVWDAQDVAFDKEQEQLDKENELLEKKLDEQQEIVERHKDAIESIEDELATSRGDRRQHLIDQLNAEMEAQRRAAAEEKRIQKEKEANEKKQDELEKKRKEAQYRRDMLQAVVNGAMAVTMAAINTWPLPAIPMMALAASTTAAQIAIMAANKPYAKGGLLEGKSHAEGGIKVPGIGNGIELEGHEFVVRKKSTAQNIDILDYINKSERKLDLSDFIDFYSSKAKKSITSMSPKRKFADGGVIPSLRTDIDINDRLMTAFEDYSDRPVVVSVQDINSRQAAVRNVQVLAGLNPE